MRRFLCAVALAALAAAPAAAAPDFGPNVKILTPTMTTAQVKAIVDPLAAAQVGNEFGTARYAILLLPGSYGVSAPLNFEVGYYTEVAGVGATPDAVQVRGTIDSYNRPWIGNALTNFHRSLSNLTMTVAGKSGCRAGAHVWAVAQQAPLRRVRINGNLRLHDGCSGLWPLANAAHLDGVDVTGTVTVGVQQQSTFVGGSVGGWSGGFWNHVFSGTAGAIPSSVPPNTVAPAVTPARPFLYQQEGAWYVQAGDRQLPLEGFHIGRPSDGAVALNDHLAACENLLLTPGVYALTRTLVAPCPGQVILGLGFPSLDAQLVATPLVLAGAGASATGLVVEGGPAGQPELVRLESPQTELHDVTVRVGGHHAGRAAVGVTVDGDGALLDSVWAWRADHGTGVGWATNPGGTGVVVNGDDVRAVSLVSEHWQGDQVVWNGARGLTVAAVTEFPYDAPAGWAGGGWLVNGADYRLYGGFATAYFRDNPTIHVARAFALPPDAQARGVGDVSILNSGTIDRIVNNVGAATSPWTTAGYLRQYPT